MSHTELELRERRLIEDMLHAKAPIGKIAAEIGRHRSTVYREIKRNYFTDDECGSACNIAPYIGVIGVQK